MFTSNFRLRERVILTENGFLCDALPEERDAEELVWKGRAKKALQVHQAELEKLLAKHHLACMEAFIEVPALFNQLCVTEALVQSSGDSKILRAAGALKNAATKERAKTENMNTAQVLLNSRRTIAAPKARRVSFESDYESGGESLGSGSADERDRLEDIRLAKEHARAERLKVFQQEEIAKLKRKQFPGANWQSQSTKLKQLAAEERRAKTMTPDEIMAAKLKDQLSGDEDVKENDRVKKNEKSRAQRRVKKEKANTVTLEDDDFPVTDAEVEEARGNAELDEKHDEPMIGEDPEIEAERAKLEKEADERKKKNERDEAVLNLEARLKLAKMAKEKNEPAVVAEPVVVAKKGMLEGVRGFLGGGG
jgi:hypothetical protein